MKILFKLFCVVFLTTLFLQAKSLRIEPNELVKDFSSYTILDTREIKLYKKGHIKGALNFPIKLTYEHIQTNGKLINPTKMQKIARALGLQTDSKIVIYDDGTFFDATRLFWALEVYGFKDVKILNAGYDTWKNLSYQTSTQTPKVKQSDYIAQINNKRIATKLTTQIATKNPNQIIIDARDKASYLGKKSTAQRFGHIPKAINYPAAHNIVNKKFNSLERLKMLYSDVDKSKKVVLYCAIGRISATNYFALRELDYNVANYDASWKEWGNDFSLPIIEPQLKNKD